MEDTITYEKKNREKNNKLVCLIVEDNTAAAELMEIFFKRNGIMSEIAENGQIGLQMYFNAPNRYDIIFLDLHMPVMDGFEVVKKIRESGAASSSFSIPIVAMSGSNTGDVVGRGRFDYFLKKPFELRKLLTVIEEVLE